MCALRLEVFETGEDAAVAAGPAAENDERRIEAYEQGYRAGWDDAAAAQAEDQRRIRMDLARNLQAMAFTFQEARSHVLMALGPLMQEIVGQLLPETAREALAPTILETLMPLAEELADAPVSIMLNPADRGAVELLLEQATGLPITIAEEPTLAEGQAFLRMSGAEVQVDLHRATAEIAAAVRGFFGLSHGE